MSDSPIGAAPPRPPDLPLELTTFVGRRHELGELVLLLDGTRLLTLTGAGGSGKTRLARELVSMRAGAPGTAEIVWVELASVEVGAQVAAAVADAVGAGEELRDPDGPTLARFLAERTLLLVLDNCEHLVDACAELVDRLLRDCPLLRVLATSREALAVHGERAWLVPALSLPVSDDVEAVRASEAARLFVERAREVSPGFKLTPANAVAVAEVCRRLDGIPLALELAAARTRLLAPEDLRARLDDAFQLLRSTNRATIPRHRTLRAAMDWSHDLLAEDTRALLRRMSVFKGGGTLDAVEAVGVGDPIDGDAFLDVLGRLVDRSLVAVGEHHGAARYTLLETVRQYALERLEDSGESEATHRRHAEHFLAEALEADPHFRGPERPLWIDRVQPDIDNFREALAWTRARWPQGHIRMVGALGWFWYSTRHWTESNRWTEGALVLPEAAEQGRDRAALLFAAGALASLQARPREAGPWLEESAALAKAAGDRSLEAYALNYLGMVHAQEGSDEGAELCRRAAEWFKSSGDLYGLRLAHLLLGTMAMYRGDLDGALRENERGVRLARRFAQPRELGISLQNTALVHINRDELERAEALVRESIEEFRKDPSHFFIATSLDYLGEILGRRGRPLEAARLLGAAETLRELVGALRFAFNERRLEALLPVLEGSVESEAWREAWEEGRRLAPEWILDALPAAQPPPVAPRAAASAPGTAARASSPPPPLPRVSEPGPVDAHDLTVRILGPFEASVDGVPAPPERWSWAKPREALIWLLFLREGTTRDRLGRALWPDTEPSRLKNSFHVTLHHLRKALGHPEWIVVEGDRYRLLPTVRVWFDATEFERAVVEANGDPEGLRRALALWRGELVEGEPVGAWIDDHRDRLNGLRLEAWMSLGSALEGEGSHEEAAELFHRVVLGDELREAAHRGLMATWARLGQRGRALRHYEKLTTLLRSELGATPEPATESLYELLRGNGESPGDIAGRP